MIINSIKWRLQLWLGFLLLCTLCGFAVATFEASRIKQERALDEQLKQRFGLITLAARGGGFRREGRMEFDRRRDEPPGKPRREGRDMPPPEPPFHGPPGPEPPDLLSGPMPNGSAPDAGRLEREIVESGIYFVIWEADGTRLTASTNAPTGVQRPAPMGPGDSGPYSRTRGKYREAFDYNRENRCVLIGRSRANELVSQRGLLLILVVAGGALLALGLGGGWWIVSRALRPIGDISATAAKIADGDLSQRINTTETENELGELANTLNSTFARLDAAFAQQKQFTADASHELRTPLAVIISEAQTTLARERTAAEYRETIEGCLATAQQMRALTESLLQLARFDAGQEEIQHDSLDLARITGDCVEALQPLVRERSLRIDCELNPAPATGDADLLKRVVTNLISNAIQYNRPAGEICVVTRDSRGGAELVVSDTGPGITPEHFPHIFKRFYRADKSRARAQGRAGLGLAICKAIVDAHGGTLEATSVIGSGSTFRLQLNRAAH